MPTSTMVRKFTTVFFAGLLLAACNPGTRPLVDTAPGGWSAGVPASAPPGASPGPRIQAFSADDAVITSGESTVLEWQVSGATQVSLEPFRGAIDGNSVEVSPSETTAYTLVADNGQKSVSQTVSIVVMSAASDWTVSEKPPALKSPLKIDVASVKPVHMKATSIHCAGLVRKVAVPGGKDAIVYMSGSKPLKYPLRVTGGRNVRVVGLQFELETQPGCGVGELPNAPARQFPNANIHPRVPGGIALRLEQSNVSFVEGLHIDVLGHEADCIVIRNPDSMSTAQAHKQRDVVVQNTYCAGVEGMGKTKIGDGVHGDFLQNQGRDFMRRLVFENVSMRTSQEGVVLAGSSSTPGAQSLVIRRYDYSWDPRYVGDDKYETFGLAFTGWPGKDWTLQDVRIDDYRDGSDYLIIRGQRYGNSPGGNVRNHPQIRSGLPPEGAFALPGRTGLNYRSPHGGVPAG